MGDIDNPSILGDRPPGRDLTLSFNTDGAIRAALLSMMTKYLTEGRSRVFVNGRHVGSLGGQRRIDPAEWQFHQFVLDEGILDSSGGQSGKEIVVHRAPKTPASSTDRFHEFHLCNIVCHFHQNA